MKQTVVVITRAPAPGFTKIRLAACAWERGVPSEAAFRNAARVHERMIQRILADTRPTGTDEFQREIHVMYPPRCTLEERAAWQLEFARSAPDATIREQKPSSSPILVRVKTIRTIFEELRSGKVIITAGTCVGFTQETCRQVFRALDESDLVFLRSESEGHAAIGVVLDRVRLGCRLLQAVDEMGSRFTGTGMSDGCHERRLAAASRKRQAVPMILLRKVVGGGRELAFTNAMKWGGRIFGCKVSVQRPVQVGRIREVDYWEDVAALMPECIPVLERRE